nr:hypothetical protein [Tanacetum cinerariifolium]
MAASAIIVSSDSFDESVGSPPSRVILFGDIPTVIPSITMVAPETSTTAPVISSVALVIKTTIVASPIGLCGLVCYSDSESDSPDEKDSLETLMLLSMLIKGAGHVSPRSSDHYPSSSSSPTDSLPVHSLGLDAPAQAHFGSSTRVVSPRLGYPPRPLHSSSHFARLSHKRCRSLTNFVPSSTPVTRSLAPTRADLLPPRKRFRDSYSYETSMEEDIKIDTIETKDGRELDIVDVDNVRDHIKVEPRDDREDFEASAGDTVVLGIDLRSVPMVDKEIFKLVGGYSSSSSGTRDGTVRSVEDIPVDLDGAIRDFYHHMSKVRVDRIVRIKTTQRQLEADQMIASGVRAGMAESIRSLRDGSVRSVEDIPVDLDGAIRNFYHHMSEVRVDRIVRIETTQRQLEADQMIASGVRAGMAESIRSLRSENLKIRDDHDDLRRKLRRTMTNTCSGMTPVVIKEMINRCVDEALKANEINRNLGLENLNRNHNGRNGNGNGGNGNGQGGNRNGDGRGDRPG